ncbi:unnamed protein product [Boreogadus saida]
MRVTPSGASTHSRPSEELSRPRALGHSHGDAAKWRQDPSRTPSPNPILVSSTREAAAAHQAQLVIMPSPYGTQATRLSSHHRAPVVSARDTGSQLLADSSLHQPAPQTLCLVSQRSPPQPRQRLTQTSSTKSSVPGRYQQYMTLETRPRLSPGAWRG